jgi:hypothetical protein
MRRTRFSLYDAHTDEESNSKTIITALLMVACLPILLD